MSRAHIELIAAVGPRWELGLNGGMPWGRIKGDLAHFVRVTAGDKLILSGRKTWQGMPPAAQRRMGPRTCVISRQLDDAAVFEALSATAAYRADHVADHRQAWGHYDGMVIIGGGEIYRAALVADLVDVIHLSVVHHPDGWAHDVILPPLDWRGWVVAARMEHPAEDGAPHGWTQLRLVRDPTHDALCAPDMAGHVPSGWLKGGCDE